MNEVCVREYKMVPKGASKKRRGYKKLPGDYVEKGMILYQQLGLRVFPGENVSKVKVIEVIHCEGQWHL